MPAGFSVIGEHGVIQVDADYKSALLRTKGSVHVPLDGSADLELGGLSFPILCARSATPVFWRAVSASNGTFRWRFYAQQGAAANVDWYLFDVGAPWQDISPGVSVYGPDGALVYNSNAKVMRIVGVHGLNYESGIPAASLGAPAGTIAVCVGGAGTELRPYGDGYLYDLVVGAIGVVGNSIISDAAFVDRGPFDANPRVLSRGTYPVYMVDVGGF